MLYKKNYKETISRLNDFYSGKGQDKVYATMNIMNPVIKEYKTWDSGKEVAYPDIEERIAFWDKALSVYTNLEDDSIPSCYLSEFDEGLYGGLVGAEVKFKYDGTNGWLSSMSIPFVKDLDEAENFTISEKSLWFERFSRQLDLFAEKSRGKFGVSHFILITGLNFLYELRGATNTYYDVLDEPDKVNKVIDFSVKLNMFIHDKFFQTTGLLDGGTCSNVAQWLPGKIVSESVDPFHLTSADMFEEWGKRVIQKVFNHFDGGVVHIHSNGHHLIDSVSQIEGLKAILLVSEDFNQPVYEKLDEIIPRVKVTPVIVSMPYDVFVNKLKSKGLHTNVLYNVMNVPDISSANRTMEKVRNYKTT